MMNPGRQIFRLGKRATSLVSMCSLPLAAVTISALPLPVLTPPAWADVTPPCSISAGSINVTATVSGTSINSATNINSTVSVTCQSDVLTFQTCSSYAAANSFGGEPWTATRQDGGTDSGSANNRIILQPAIGPTLSTFGTAADTIYGNRSGFNNGFPIFFRYGPPAGAVVESGIYQATIQASSILIDDTGALTSDPNCANRGSSTTTEFAFSPVNIPITITVPESCVSTFPTELNFGDISDTSVDHDASATITTTCNSNTLKYNVYISGGTGSDNGQLAMGNGTGGTLAYGLYTDPARQTPFEQAGLGAANVDTAGPHTRTTAAGGDVVTIYGKVPAQTRPPSGDYSDTVMIHVEY